MVRNMKVARYVENRERERTERELRKRGIEPPKKPGEKEPEPCCCDQEPKLPAGWKRVYSKKHAIYFYHHEGNGVSQWAKPVEVPPSDTLQTVEVAPVVPPEAPKASAMERGEAKKKAVPEPPEPPTTKEKMRSIYDEMAFTCGLVFCWCCLYSNV